jgi:hypothetical protein
MTLGSYAAPFLVGDCVGLDTGSLALAGFDRRDNRWSSRRSR